MSGTKSLVLDTNIIVYLLNGDTVLEELLNENRLVISVITEMELLSYNTSQKEEKIIRDFVNECQVIELNKTIKEYAISLRKRHKLKLPDGIVAATAYFMNIPLITADTDFNRLEEIEILLYKL